MHMPNWRTLVDKEFLGSWDVEGRDFTLEVMRVESGLVKSQLDPSGKRKVVIIFRGARKKFIVNATNCTTIEAMYGANTDNWVGKRVTLYATKVRSPKGGSVLGVRVRPKPPQGVAETLPEREVDAAVRAEQDAAFREPGED